MERDPETDFVRIMPSEDYPDFMPAETLNAKVARAIAADWMTFFPEFKYWRTRTLARVVAPVVQIILLERDSSGACYHPIHQLAFLSSNWHEIGFADTFGFYCESKLKPAAGWIDLHDHHHRIGEAATEMREDLAFMPLEGDWQFDHLLDVAWRLAKKNKSSWPQVLRDVVLLCTWAGRVDLAHRYYRSAKVRYYGLFGPLNAVERLLSGPNPRWTQWREDIDRLIDHPGKVRELAEANLVRFKLDKLRRAKLIV